MTPLIPPPEFSAPKMILSKRCDVYEPEKEISQDCYPMADLAEKHIFKKFTWPHKNDRNSLIFGPIHLNFLQMIAMDNI